MVSSLLAQLNVFFTSLAAVAMSITPMPSQLGINANTSSSQNVGSAGNSRNWSGYVATAGGYTAITGTWIVPQVTTSGHTATDATWIGIGGVSSNDLIQSGTQNVISPSGQVTTTAFYELLPDASIPITSIAVKPGDSVTVTITQQSTDQWIVAFKDNTTNQNYQNTVTYHSTLSSAEWIEEAPSNGVRVLPLDNFGTVQFSNSSVTQNSSQIAITTSGAHTVTMVNNASQTLATPSALGSDGESFSVTRSNAVSNPPIPDFDRYPGKWRRIGRGIGATMHFVWHAHSNSYPISQPTASPQPTNASASGIQVIFHPRHFGSHHF